jgi:hypothetical protein
LGPGADGFGTEETNFGTLRFYKYQIQVCCVYIVSPTFLQTRYGKIVATNQPFGELGELVNMLLDFEAKRAERRVGNCFILFLGSNLMILFIMITASKRRNNTFCGIMD